jgi:hypothetical protein
MAADASSISDHPRWREVRDRTKFAHMLTFGNALPRIRQRVESDIRRPGLPREKLLAAMVRLWNVRSGASAILNMPGRTTVLGSPRYGAIMPASSAAISSSISAARVACTTTRW